MRCGSPNKPDKDAPFIDILTRDDKWEHREGSRFRYCSFCGSMHYDDAKTALSEGAKIDTTGKSYKRYIVEHPDLHLSQDKFYMWHAESD